MNNNVIFTLPCSKSCFLITLELVEEDGEAEVGHEESQKDITEWQLVYKDDGADTAIGGEDEEAESKQLEVTLRNSSSYFKDDSTNLKKFIERPLLLRHSSNFHTASCYKHTDREVFEDDSADVRKVKQKKDEAGFDLIRIMHLWYPPRTMNDVFNDLFKTESLEDVVHPSNETLEDSSIRCHQSPSSIVDIMRLNFRCFQYFLIRMCRKYDEDYWDLILHGKEVEEKIGRRITNADIPLIFEFLSYNPEIKYVDLCYNRISDHGFNLISHYLKFNPAIIGLNLMNNNIHNISSATGARLGMKSNLKQLRLNGNRLTKNGRAIAAKLLKYNKLELLDLGDTQQNLVSSAWLAESALSCTSIQVLDMSRLIAMNGYNLRTYHLAILVEDILKYNTSLIELHLQKNLLDDSDVAKIMDGLVLHPKLKLIDLCCNRIADLGLERIAMCLPKAKTLEALMLSCNSIRNDGARALSYKLPYSRVSTLDIARNKISDAGIIDLLNTVCKPHRLLAFYFFGNPFGVPALKKLYDLIQDGHISPDNVDTHVRFSSDEYEKVHNPLGDRYKPRYYRQYERWGAGIWRWNGTVPMHYHVKELQPLINHFPEPQNVLLPMKSAFKKTCSY